MKLENR